MPRLLALWHASLLRKGVLPKESIPATETGLIPTAVCFETSEM
jgi:hypothetical protein